MAIVDPIAYPLTINVPQLILLPNQSASVMIKTTSDRLGRVKIIGTNTADAPTVFENGIPLQINKLYDIGAKSGYWYWAVANSESNVLYVSESIGYNREASIPIDIFNHICEDNTTIIPIGENETFNGDWQDTLGYVDVRIGISTDQDSATDGLVIEWSTDSITVHDSDTFSILADRYKTFSFAPARRYVRLKYTNGAIAQSFFNIETRLSKVMGKPSSHRIQDNIVAEDDAELQKSVLTGEDEDGIFRNVKTTKDGNLSISDNSSGLAIAEGNVTGVGYIHKFGNAPDFDTADGEVTVWDGAEDGEAWERMQYVFSTTADIDSISSSSASDTQAIEIQGLDINYNLINQTITLNGQSRVPLTTNLLRVFRMFNDNTVDLVGHVFCYVNVALSGGIPTNTANIRAVIQPENNQTEMAVYTIPAGKTGYMVSWYASTSGASKDTNYIMRLKSRLQGKVFRLKDKKSISDIGTSTYQHTYFAPEKFTEKTDIIMTTEMTAGGASGGSISAGYEIILKDN